MLVSESKYTSTHDGSVIVHGFCYAPFSEFPLTCCLLFWMRISWMNQWVVSWNHFFQVFPYGSGLYCAPDNGSSISLWMTSGVIWCQNLLTHGSPPLHGTRISLWWMQLQLNISFTLPSASISPSTWTILPTAWSPSDQTHNSLSEYENMQSLEIMWAYGQ